LREFFKQSIKACRLAKTRAEIRRKKETAARNGVIVIDSAQQGRSAWITPRSGNPLKFDRLKEEKRR